LNEAADRSDVDKISRSHVKLGDDEVKRCEIVASLDEQMRNRFFSDFYVYFLFEDIQGNAHRRKSSVPSGNHKLVP
jgi:hypothetical protein